MNPANFVSSRVNVSLKDYFDFASPEPVYIHTGIFKPNTVGDSNVRFFNNSTFSIGHRIHTFNYPLCIPIEQSFIGFITIRMVIKNLEDVLFENSVVNFT